jgi:hypothetical protein
LNALLIIPGKVELKFRREEFNLNVEIIVSREKENLKDR